MKDYEKLIQYGLRISAKKRYTVFEMRKKLKQAGKKLENPREEVIDLVLERLLELKYLDDKAYIDDYIRDRVNFKPRGKLLLKKELQLKGLRKELIQDALKNQNIDEFELAKKALEKKLFGWKKYPFEKQRNKAFLFLTSKGFGQDPIYKAINDCYNEVR